MIQNAFLIGCDGQRHDFAATRLGKSRVNVDQRLETGNGGSEARGGGGGRRGKVGVGLAENEIVERGRCFEPNAATRQLE